MNKALRLANLTAAISLAIAGCSNGPDPDALFQDWLSPKMPDRWSQGSYIHKGSAVSITVSMEDPYDQDYVGSPAWQMQSFARSFCPSLSELQRMGIDAKTIQIETKGKKVGHFAKVNCPTGYVEDK